MNESRYWAVNWADGMKISRQHLLQSDQYLAGLVRDAQAISLTPFGFGLLPNAPLGVQLLNGAGGQLIVRITACQALTPDGSRIDLRDTEEPVTLHTSLAQLRNEFQLSEQPRQTFFVVLTVNLFDPQPIGEPNSDELPIRQPFARPRLLISVVPDHLLDLPQWSGPHLIVGRVDALNAELHPQPGYLPACCTSQSHTILRDWYNRLGTLLSELETYSFRIIQKITTKSQPTTLAASAEAVTKGLIDDLTDQMTTFRWRLPYKSPIRVIELCLRLGQHIRSSLACLSSRDQEELLGYLAEWADETPGSIESRLMTLSQLTYIHANLAPTLQAVEEFWLFWTGLFNKLSQLEFIGKRKGQQVFIIENPVHDPPDVPEKPRVRWSPI